MYRKATVKNFEAAERRELVLKAAVQQGLLNPERALVAAFLDLDALKMNVTALNEAFASPAKVLHAFAAKASCLVPVLAELSKLGMGCEVASEGELAQALAAGFPPERIIFDSPAKTRPELRQALALGIAVNADNFQELERIAELISARPSKSIIGIRINPQVGLGGIEAMSTAGATSKFGIALKDEGSRERLLEAYQNFPWLTRMHAHVGSQGCSLELIAEGISRVVEFADEVNSRSGRQQVTGIDIGGGLPVDFDSDILESTFSAYVDELKKAVPNLLDGRYEIVTEFGRSILAKFGFIAAYVEYTKSSGGRQIAVTHAGAQVATRTVFMPDAWPIRIGAHDHSGRMKHDDPVRQDLAGPCCFAGDLIAQNRLMPPLGQGDIITLLDTGAYYFSTPFNYNSLLEPGVYGATISSGGIVQFITLRRPQTISDLLERSGANELSLPSTTPTSLTQDGVGDRIAEQVPAAAAAC